MNGSREIDLRVRRALTEANAAIDQVSFELTRLVRQLEDLRHATVHLHDERLSERLEEIQSAIDGARSLAEHHSIR